VSRDEEGLAGCGLGQLLGPAFVTFPTIFWRTVLPGARLSPGRDAGLSSAEQVNASCPRDFCVSPDPHRQMVPPSERSGMAIVALKQIGLE
jgi:hypothetical protein